MKNMVILVLVLLSLLFLLNINAKYTSRVIPRHMLEGGPEWEKYILDEEANKDKLYCRTTEDEYRNIIETRWYNYFINPNDVVRVDEGDTTTPNCEYPMHTPVYAKGSNKGKVYSRVVMDFEGNILQTTWYNACTNEIINTDEGDTTYSGSNTFSEKCYHPNYTIEEEEENEEETIIESYVSVVGKAINWFKSLFNM